MDRVLELQQENARIRAQLRDREGLLASHEDSLKAKDRLIEQLKEALILSRHRQFARVTK